MSEGIAYSIGYVDLSKRTWKMDCMEQKEFRLLFGGAGFIAKELLRLTPKNTDPLGKDNVFIIATGPLTGIPVPGSGRVAVGAKSPLTDGFGVAESGGYFGVEMRKAGFDALVVTGVSDSPVYLYLKDGSVEFCDAGHIKGKTTGEAEGLIKTDLKTEQVKILQCGPAGENLVKYSAVASDIVHYAGRCGMGAVMGSKNLRAVAALGTKPIPVVNKEKLMELTKWMNRNWKERSLGLSEYGSAGGVMALDSAGGLPTRNFRQGSFEGANKISGQTLKDTILVGQDSCYACPIRCKRVVECQTPYQIDPLYGGPEYETIASFGSLCGVDDIRAICKANEMCNAYGLDTIGTGVSIAFAMECYENGLLSKEDTGGLELTFGNSEAMLSMVENIIHRKGLGDLLAQGTMRAAKAIGPEAEQFAMHVRGQEIPMHEPRLKWGLGVGYGVSITGADHNHNVHDTTYGQEHRQVDDARALGIGAVPIPPQDLSAAKVHLLKNWSNLRYFTDSALMCIFLPWDATHLVEMVKATTGWDTGTAEILEIGERTNILARMYNLREGMKHSDEKLPKRFFQRFESGPLKDKPYTEKEWMNAKISYYRQSGMTDQGVPTEDTIKRLAIDRLLN